MLEDQVEKLIQSWIEDHLEIKRVGNFIQIGYSKTQYNSWSGSYNEFNVISQVEINEILCTLR